MRVFLTVCVSFLLAIILAVLPLPHWLNYLCPDWIVLVLVYWVMVMPHRFSVGFAWLIGLLMDVLFGAPLGEHALVLVAIAYCVTKFYMRIRLFNLQQQMLMIFGVIIMYRAILFWLQGIVGNIPDTLLYWLPSITSAIFWPWVFILLRDYDQHFKVSESG